jgi:glycosyltransferase involved in cell wall biosynthesis
MHSKIGYFINQYPKISHAFIRREILALERQDFHIQRIALRGWDADILDSEDQEEQNHTQYVLRGGPLPLIGAALQVLISAPKPFFAALALAFRMSKQAERSLPYHLVYFLEACLTLQWLKAFGATHVHAHFGTNSTEVVMLAHALGGPPYSFTVHGPLEFDRPLYLGLGEKIRRAAFVVAITSYCRSQLSRWVGHVHWPKLKVIHCGLEAAFHDAVNIPPPESSRLVCIGRLCEQKGQLLLIEAAAKVAAKGVKFELVLVGGGEMRGEIEALIAKYSLKDQVFLTGSVSTEKLREEIIRARALVLPSFAEGLPMVLMEAMALRRPVLTTYVAGIPELVLNGENGLLFAAGSIEALALAMEDILSRSPDQLRIMGEAAYTRVLERHSIDIEAAKLGELFRKSSESARTGI